MHGKLQEFARKARLLEVDRVTRCTLMTPEGILQGILAGIPGDEEPHPLHTVLIMRRTCVSRHARLAQLS
jgi:hypothetical protein